MQWSVSVIHLAVVDEVRVHLHDQLHTTVCVRYIHVHVQERERERERERKREREEMEMERIVKIIMFAITSVHVKPLEHLQLICSVFCNCMRSVQNCA